MATPAADPHDLGRRGEDLAARYLESKGLVVLERRYRFNRAEVDLICFHPSADGDGGEIVFVEVKTRSGTGFGRPEEAVTEAKQRQLFRAAEAFMHERKLEGALARFDVVAILIRHGGRPEIRHFENAFWAFGF